MPNETLAIKNPTFVVADSEEVVQGARLKLNADGTVEQAGALDNTIGFANRSVSATDTDRSISMTGLNADGVISAIGVTGIAVADLLGAAANGQVTTGTGLNFMAMTATTATGQSVLIIPLCKDT